MVDEVGDAVTTRLAAVELRCLLARKRRAGLLTPELEAEAYARFLRQVADGEIRVLAFRDAEFATARELIEALPDVPLRTLDALHLTAAWSSGAAEVATADRVLAEAAGRLGLRVRSFGA